MKKEMSSFDVRSIVSELNVLEGSHMDKIFQPGAGDVLFRINFTGEGKKDLFFKDRKWLYLPPEKPETPVTPTSFATYLRKYLDNARIGKSYQMGFDRTVVMELFKAEKEYKLIFELFGGGNVLLVSDGKIDNCLIHKSYRNRVTRPGEEYVLPEGRFDPSSCGPEDFKQQFRSSDADAVRTMATVINLGGQYAEEVCKRAGVEKNTPQSDISDDMLAILHDSMKDVLAMASNGNEPTAFVKDGEMIDIAPVMMNIYEDCEARRFDSMSLAIDAYVKQISRKTESERKDPEIDKLEKRIAKQLETVNEYNEKCQELRSQADALYAEYQKTNELLEVLCQQSKRLDWVKLKEGAMRIPFVKDIDPSCNKVVATIAETTVTLDYTKGIDANASDIYARSKEIGEKGKRAEDALNESKAELDKRMKGLEKERILAAGRAKPTKEFWFERYKWFITSEGRLVLAGRDTHSNDNVVKKHMKDDDVFAHADVHGAPSTILKDGKHASDAELREACTFALAQSKSWIASLSEGASFWVYPDQVSKTPNPGEFVPRGAFIVRGKRNYEHHLTMELAIGEIFYEGHRKIMCGPLSAFKDSANYDVIRPGREKNGRMAGDIAKEFNVPEEEISRILPPGNVEIVRKVRSEPDRE